MTLDDLLGRVFETHDGTRMRLVGYDRRERIVRMATESWGTPSQRMPMGLFFAARETGALQEV